MKTNFINLENHFSISSSYEIAQICQPLLKYFGITYFQFRRTFRDRSRAVLSNQPEFIQRYYGSKNFGAYGTFESNNASSIQIDPCIFSKWVNDSKGETHGISAVLWSQLENQNVFKDIFSECRAHNISNGITLAENCGSYCNFYHIGTEVSNTNIVPLYFNYIDLLMNFILYFKDKAAPLISQAEKNRIISPDLSTSETKPPSFLGTKDEAMNLFLKETEIKRYFINDKVFLTRKEAECLYYMMRGLSAKEIGANIFRSPRTVEDIINNLKNKLVCNSKSEVVSKAYKLKLNEILIF